MSESVSENLVRLLADNGIRHIWGVPGDALNSVNDAIRSDGRIKWIGTRHEEVAAFAAGAEAALSGQLAVCAGTVGPGAVHLINGLYDAARNGAPVLALTGQVPLAEMGTDFFQEVDLDGFFKEVSVYNETIVTPAQMPRLLRMAVHAAVSKRGVAVLTLPGDIGPQPISDSGGQINLHVDHHPTRACDADLEKAASLINGAKRVTVMAGTGAFDARTEVLEMCDIVKAPLAVSLRGKEIFEHDNPNYVAMTGLIGNPAAHHALHSCDVLVLVGTDFPYRDWYPDGTTVIQIDHDASHIGRRVDVTCGLVGDAGSTVEALLPLLTFKSDEAHRAASVDRYEKWRLEQDNAAKGDGGVIDRVGQKVLNPDGRVRPPAVAAAISELADDDAIFTADVGMCIVWAARFLKMKKDQRFLSSFHHGSMANAMPQALGAQAHYPGRQVISMSGDGGLSMLLGDLITAVTYNLPIKVIVFDNGRLGMVKLEQEAAGIAEVAVELVNPDFSKVAAAIGLTSFRVEDPADLHSTIETALATEGPVLVDVLTSPNEVSVPPKTSIEEGWGFAISKIKETLGTLGAE
jgi:pyruvate dehydrogenase (quinone)